MARPLLRTLVLGLCLAGAALLMVACVATSKHEPERHTHQLQGQTSHYAGGIVSQTNAERRKAGLRDLSIDNELTAAANQRARELVSRFSHTRPDGRSYETVLRECHVSAYKSWGENILYNMSEDPADAMRSWMNSSGHRANILGRDFTHIGVGVYRSGGKVYVVQLFLGRGAGGG